MKFLTFKEAWKAWSIKWQSLFATIVVVWMLTPAEKQAQVLALFPGEPGVQQGVLVLAGIAIGVYARMKLQANPPRPTELPPQPPTEPTL